MNAIESSREMLKQAAGFLEMIMEDVTQDQAHWMPGGAALPIGAHYAHIAIGADGFVNGMLAGKVPLFTGEWAGKVGVSDLPPQAQPGASPLPQPWDQWARTLRVDLPQLRRYAQAVHASCDEFLATLTDADLERPVDLSAQGLGTQTLGWVIGAGVSGHVWAHLGEISCVKGLQGQKGYPV